MSFDRLGDLRPPGDQGNRGTCLAFAATAGHALSRVATRGRPALELSEEALYHLAKAIDSDDRPGTTPASVGRALAETGQPVLSRWPYDATLTDLDPLPAPPAGSLDPAGLHRASLHTTGSDFDELEAALRAGFGVVLGINVWPALYTPTGDAVATPTASDLLGDGHAVLLVGVDEGERRLLIRNSWGTTWGALGHAWISEIAWRRAGLGAWLLRDDIDR